MKPKSAAKVVHDEGKCQTLIGAHYLSCSGVPDVGLRTYHAYLALFNRIPYVGHHPAHGLGEAWGLIPLQLYCNLSKKLVVT